jgi:esterase
MMRLTMAALALGVMFGLPSGARAQWAIPDEVMTVSVGGYPLAYRETGSGEPIVLVHGSLGDYRIRSAGMVSARTSPSPSTPPTWRP